MGGINISAVLGLWLLAAGTLAAPSHPLLKQNWQLLESENFSVMTNLKDRPARALLVDLEQFRQVVLAITGIGEVTEPIGTRVIVFAKHSQFNRIAFKANTLGYMRPSFRGNRMVSSSASLSIDQRSIMFHEYVHHLVRIASSRNYPTWYDEGLADSLSTIHEDNGRLVIGAGSEVRLRGLSSNVGKVSLASIVNEDNLNRFHPYVVSYYYSLSWALVNYIQTSHMVGLPNRLEQLQHYLQLLTDQHDRASAFTQAFGVSPLQMEKEVFAYLERRQRPVISLPVEPFAYHGTIAQRKMGMDEVALEIAFQAMLGKTKQAHKILDAALVHHPNNAALLSAKGVTYQFEGRFEQGEPLVRAAYQSNQRDPILAIDYADLLVDWNAKQCAEQQTEHCRQRWQVANKVYAKTLALFPDNPELRAVYGWVLLDHFQDYSGALKHLQFALQFQPWNANLHLRVGLAHKGLEQRDNAVTHLKRALYWTENSSVRNAAEEALVQLGALTSEQTGLLEQ